MFCAITGETPEEPVVSLKSGHVFEKRAILKWLEANGNTWPDQDHPLTPEDLLPMKVEKTVRPRPTTATSIPSLLHLFQNEWDAVMLECYSLKQQLESVRQELSHALYQHDAACRVIARLIKERDDARSELANMRSMAPQPSGMEVESSGISEDIKAKLQEKSVELSSERKQRKISDALAKAETIKEYSAMSSTPTHKSSEPGILCLDIHPGQEKIVTGGVDSTAVVFDRHTKKISSTLSGHSKKVVDVLFHPTRDVIFTASADKTAKVWTAAEGGYTTTHTVKDHSQEVTGISLHPTGDYYVTGSLDGSWGFHDLSEGKMLAQLQSTAPISSIQFHPDGLILGTGLVTSVVQIWDVKSQKNVASFEGHKDKVLDISFSENGYYLATVGQENTVKLWDLRRLKNFYSIDLDQTLSAVSFDYSGTYLAVTAGNTVRVYMGKTLNHIATYSDHKGDVTDVAFGNNAQWLASTSMDRTLKVWGKK